MIGRKIECPCKNMCITVVRNEDGIDNPFDKGSIKEIVNGTLVSKYTFLTQTKTNSNWNVSKCLHCKCDFCATERDNPKIIIVFDCNEDMMNGGKLSQTYGIILKHHISEEGFIGEEERREIAKIRQNKIEQLYNEKERKIAEFVKKIEERYEIDKSVVEEEEKDMITACSTEEIIVEENEEESYFSLDVENPFGAEESNEDNSTLTKEFDVKKNAFQKPNIQNKEVKQVSNAIGFLEMVKKENKANSIRIARSLTEDEKLMDEAKDNFPSTFQEYVCVIICFC